MLKVDARVRGGCRAMGRACTGVRMCLLFREVAPDGGTCTGKLANLAQLAGRSVRVDTTTRQYMLLVSCLLLCCRGHAGEGIDCVLHVEASGSLGVGGATGLWVAVGRLDGL